MYFKKYCLSCECTDVKIMYEKLGIDCIYVLINISIINSLTQNQIEEYIIDKLKKKFPEIKNKNLDIHNPYLEYDVIYNTEENAWVCHHGICQ